MNFSEDKISEVISANIKNVDSLFVFPTDVVQTSWINWAIKNPDESGVRAFNLDQFTAWDKFKSDYLKASDENLICIPPVVRKVFLKELFLLHQSSRIMFLALQIGSQKFFPH